MTFDKDLQIRIRQTRIDMYKQHIEAKEDEIDMIGKWIIETQEEIIELLKENITEEEFDEYLLNKELERIGIK